MPMVPGSPDCGNAVLRVQIVAAEASWVFRFAKELNVVCSLRIAQAATAARFGLGKRDEKVLV